MYLEESVNSDIWVRAPPDYMHINFESFARQDGDTARSEGGDVEQQELENIKQDRLRAKVGDARLREVKVGTPEQDRSILPKIPRLRATAV